MKRFFRWLFGDESVLASLGQDEARLEFWNRHSTRTIEVFGVDHATGEEFSNFIGPGERLKFPEGCELKYAKFKDSVRS